MIAAGALAGLVAALVWAAAWFARARAAEPPTLRDSVEERRRRMAAEQARQMDEDPREQVCRGLRLLLEEEG